MNLRLAVEADIAPLLEISNWAALNTHANFAIEPEPLEDWLAAWRATREKHPWLVACDGGGTVLGFAKSSPHRGRCAYAYTAEVSVYVHPQHHGKRIGHALYAKLIPMLKAQGYVTLLAGISTPNDASVRLHESFGFKRIGLFERVGWKFGRWHDVGYWELILNDSPQPPARILAVRELAADKRG